jgi:hypothetical protein
MINNFCKMLPKFVDSIFNVVDHMLRTNFFTKEFQSKATDTVF